MSKKIPLSILSTCSAMALALAAAPSLAQSENPVGLIQRFHRDAYLQRITADNERHVLYRDYGFFLGDTLEMNKGPCVPAVIWDHTALRLGPESKLKIAAAGTGPAKKGLILELQNGGIEVEVPEESAGKLLVRTSDTELRLGQGTFAIAMNEDGLTEVLAYDGPVKIASAGQTQVDFGARGRFLHAIHRDNKIELLQEMAGQPDTGPPALPGLDCRGSLLGDPNATASKAAKESQANPVAIVQATVDRF